MENIFESWNWYVAGPLIGLFVPLLLWTGNKAFGISSSFTHICYLLLPEKKKQILNYDYKTNAWKFLFVLGIAAGAYISVNFLSAEKTAFLPQNYYTLSGMIKLFTGGLLVGFGTRYANGCTSGHAITGLSLLQSSSLKATLSFFAGGLIYTFIEFNLF
jgi:hypothetical protein